MKVSVSAKHSKMLDSSIGGYTGRQIIESMCGKMSGSDFRELLALAATENLGGSNVVLPQKSNALVEIELSDNCGEIIQVIKEDLRLDDAQAASFLIDRFGSMLGQATAFERTVAEDGDLGISIDELSELTGIPKDDIPQDFENLCKPQKKHRSASKRTKKRRIDGK